MATVKLYLRTKVLSDGTSPLVLKVYKDGKPSISHLGISLKHDDWDAVKKRVRKSHPNATKLNNLLLKKLADANDKAIDATTVDEQVTAKAVIKKIKPKANTSFYKRADVYFEGLKAAGDFNEYNANLPRLKHFKEFLNNEDIAFSEITPNLLEKYATHLRNTRKVGKEQRPIKERTVLNHLIIIRSIFSHAIEEGIVDKKYYPFGGKDGVSIKLPESAKIGLESEDVVNIENAEFTNPNYSHARNLWLISFYFGGMRASDVFRLRWSDFVDDRLHYTMGKNDKAGALKADERVFYILDQYKAEKRSNNDFIFPELKAVKNIHDEFTVEKVINDSVVRIDKFLRKHVAPKAGVTQRLTLHIARHTFGNLAGEQIPLPMLQKIFRHSKITTTMAYMANFKFKETDDALGAVLAKVKKQTANDNEQSKEVSVA